MGDGSWGPVLALSTNSFAFLMSGSVGWTLSLSIHHFLRFWNAYCKQGFRLLSLTKKVRQPENGA